MPHVVLEGPITLEDIWLVYQPLQARERDCIFKTEDCYLSAEKTQLLVRAMTVEGGYTRRFYVLLLQKEGSITIKLEPLTDPEKTDGTRRLLGLITERILTAEPEARIARTNIQDFLKPLA